MTKLVTFLLVAAWMGPCLAQDRHSLAGLQGVGVVVDYTDQLVEGKGSPIGLSKDDLKVAAELRLRRNGIRVLTGALPGVLEVGVESFCPESCVFVIMLRLHQGVYLKRDPKRSFSAATWYRTTIVMGGTDDPLGFKRQISDGVGELVDDFSNDFLAENPKP